jgi:hypothetical protein
MIDYGSVIIDAYRTYNTSYKTVMEGFVGSGDPELHFMFDELCENLHLTVQGDCKSSPMREWVRSVGHNLYLPFTKSLKGADGILTRICQENAIDDIFRPTSYSDPERNVRGAVEVPKIIAKYGHVYTMTPSFYWDHENETTFQSQHSGSRERLYVDWENPKEKHTKWQQVIWMKDEFHFGLRCKGFERTEEFTPISETVILVIRLSKDEIGRLTGLMNKMLEDYNKYGAKIKKLREK